MKILLILLLILIYYFNKTITEIKPKQKIINIINLEEIKNNFNYNKNKIIFNKAILPVEKTTKYNINHINNLFNYIFNMTDIKLINIINVTLFSIENQKNHICIFETNVGLIKIDLISNKILKNDIFDQKDVKINDYLNEIVYIENYKPIEEKKPLDGIAYIEEKKKQYENNLNPDINNYDINNFIN